MKQLNFKLSKRLTMRNYKPKHDECCYIILCQDIAVTAVNL